MNLHVQRLEQLLDNIQKRRRRSDKLQVTTAEMSPPPSSQPIIELPPPVVAPPPVTEALRTEPQPVAFVPQKLIDPQTTHGPAIKPPKIQPPAPIFEPAAPSWPSTSAVSVPVAPPVSAPSTVSAPPTAPVQRAQPSVADSGWQPGESILSQSLRPQSIATAPVQTSGSVAKHISSINPPQTLTFGALIDKALRLRPKL